MIKWIVFAVVSLTWIATCYVFGSLVGGTTAGVPAARAQDECAQRLVDAAARGGRVLDIMAARAAPECREIHLRTLRELSAPAIRQGLLWGVLPVVFIGGLMLLRSRQYG